MTKKRRHHILPRFYLEGFLSPIKKTLLYQYEKGSPEIVKTSVENASVIKDYYSIKEPESEEDKNIVEEALSVVKYHAAPILKKIKAKEDLSDKDKENFSVFLAYMFTRVPHHRQMTEDLYGKGTKAWLMAAASHPEGFKNLIKKYENASGNKVDHPVETLREFLKDEDNYDVQTHPNACLGFIHFGIKMAPVF